MKMTKNNADGLMSELMTQIIKEKYSEVPLDVVNNIIAISKDNRERAKSLKVTRKYLNDYFNLLKQCSE